MHVRKVAEFSFNRKHLRDGLRIGGRARRHVHNYHLKLRADPHLECAANKQLSHVIKCAAIQIDESLVLVDLGVEPIRSDGVSGAYLRSWYPCVGPEASEGVGQGKV